MSRVHSSQNNHSDYSSNAENYLSKMIKNKRQVAERPRTELKLRDKSASRASNLLQTRPIIKSGPTVRAEEPRRKPSDQDIVRKEVFNNNMATVEVTVRTVAPKGSETKPGMEESREPWGKILGARKSEDNLQCNFGNFDPLRTLHFLSKELQLKLQNLCPGDPSIHQIVNDMQNAMQRLPPEVICQFKSSDPHGIAHISSGDNDPPTNIKKSVYYNDRKVSKQSQTVIIGDTETKKMQQQLEDSAIKLEASCKEMENVCSKLRSERDDLESMLFKERETVVSLKKELQERVSEKEEKSNNEIHKLIHERDALKKQVMDLQTQAESQLGHEDLRVLVEDFRNKQLAVEQENTTRRNELTIMKLERDKMNVLLECRDKQLKELRNELDSIQQLVSIQLMEIKAKPTFSATSTISCGSQLWNVPSSVKSKKCGKSIHELYLNNDMRKMLLNKDLRFAESGTNTTLNADEIIKERNFKLENDNIQEIPQRDKSENKIKSSQMTMTSDSGADIEFMNKLSSPSIKDMFAEIKRQAFKKIDVTLQQPPTHKDKETTPYESQTGSHGSLSS